MSHLTNPDKEYRLLQQKLDTIATGAPDSPVFLKILKLMFSPEEAGLAAKLPIVPAPLSKIAQNMGMDENELEKKLSNMAKRGALLDLEIKGDKYFFLPPVVLGFFEYTFMRSRDDVPMKEIAELFEQYMHESSDFARSVFQKDTQIGRALVSEETIGDYTDVLDYESAVSIVKRASSVGVSTCACRHEAHHLGRDCGHPLDVCLTLNSAADTMIRNGHARRITNEEALEIIADCKKRGLVQTADNVKNEVSYICNCCSCCCGMLRSINEHGITNAIVHSGWVMTVITDKCRGCGACISACPVKAISLELNTENRKKAVCNTEMCLGCGVCPPSCRYGALVMERRPVKVFTPDDVIDKTIAMALERGKLTELIFDSPEKFTHRTAARLIKALESSPPYKAAMAIKPLRSKFLNALVSYAKKRTEL